MGLQYLYFSALARVKGCMYSCHYREKRRTKVYAMSEYWQVLILQCAMHGSLFYDIMERSREHYEVY